MWFPGEFLQRLGFAPERETSKDRQAIWDLSQVYGVCAAIFVLSCLVCSPLCHSQTAATRPTQHGLSNFHWVFNIWWWKVQIPSLPPCCTGGKQLPWVPKSIFVLEVSLLLLNPINGSPSAICYASWYYKNHRMWAGNTMVMGKGAWGIKLIVMPLFSEKLGENKLGPSSCFWLD